MKDYFYIDSSLNYHLKNNVRPSGLILTRVDVAEYETPYTAPRTVVMVRKRDEDEDLFFLKGPTLALENNRNLADWQWHLEANAAAGYQWGCVTLHFGEELLSEQESNFLQKNAEYSNLRHRLLHLARKADTKAQYCWAMEQLRKLMLESVDPIERVLSALELAKLHGYMDERDYRGLVRHVEKVTCEH